MGYKEAKKRKFLVFRLLFLVYKNAHAQLALVAEIE
jgi:hypothetical protein